MMKNQCITAISKSDDSRSSVPNKQHLCALMHTSALLCHGFQEIACRQYLLSTPSLKAESITIDYDIVRYRVLCDLCEDCVSEQVATVCHAPYTWTLKQMVWHLIDVKRIFADRLHRFACMDARCSYHLPHQDCP